MQGYAVEAAEAAAVLFEAFGDGRRGRAARRGRPRCAERFRDRFWVGDGRRPATWPSPSTADGRSVDGVASNMGHLLGTGTLDEDEVARVAATLTSPQMLGRYGIGTLATDNGGFNPIGYHTGSVWTHDTAICAWGLMREGRREEAGLVAAQPARLGRGIRLPLARAVRRVRDARPARAVPGLVPAAGVVRRVRGGPARRWRSASRRTRRRAGSCCDRSDRRRSGH